MTDDLVERLLDWPYQGETMAHEAADRIEQLTAELADAEALIEAQAKDHASNNIRFAEAEQRAKVAEAERDEAWAYMSAAQGDLYDAIMIEAERDRLREALTALHKQALMLRGEQSYREFARAVEKQARAALKGETP